MNLKRLEQLVRLANNNPNDNEANLAARRVCKMIEESGFKFVADVAVPVPPPINQARSWNDVKRSTTAQWSSRRPSGSGNPFGQKFWDEFFVDYDRDRSWTEPPRNKEPQPTYDPTYSTGGKHPNTDTDTDTDTDKYEYYTDENGQQRRRVRPDFKQKLKCSNCKQEFETGFLGIPELFMCTTCQWDIYQRTKGQSTL